MSSLPDDPTIVPRPRGNTSIRERILDRALERFNDEGIEYVGVRELAKDLGVKGGNITYYFPTKDDLVAAIGARLRERNDRTIALPATPSLLAFMQMLGQIFRNHHDFRCLFMSLPNLMTQNEAIAAMYVGKVEHRRRRVVGSYLESLREVGLLQSSVTDDQIERVVGLVGLVSRGWIGDAAISHRDRTLGWRMTHYLRIVSDHLRGIATPRGIDELSRFEDGLQAG